MTTTCPSCTSSLETCARCSRVMCRDHASVSGTCLDCEVAYYESRDTVPLRAWFVGGALLPWPVLASQWAELSVMPRSGGFRAITTGFPALDALAMTVFASMWLGLAAVAMRRWVHRRRFLAA